jgi:hypothetical protein
MPSAWTVTRNDVASIHTYIASEDGWLVNSHIIELPSQLFVVDAQYTLSNAREVVRHARDLGKPARPLPDPPTRLGGAKRGGNRGFRLPSTIGEASGDVRTSYARQ